MGSKAGPDSVILKDGTKLRGLIVQNTASSIVLVRDGEEQRIPKNQIARIQDEDDTGSVCVKALKADHLPSWRVIVNDLRTKDSVRSLVQIPAMRVEVGPLAFVPYKSFRINENLEMNIYGNPEDPVALEIGIYNLARNDNSTRKLVRGYMAGFLNTRGAINALYSLDLQGGKARAGNMTVEITPPDAPDAFGSWWLSFYREAELPLHRLSPENYARVTVSPEVFERSRGRHRSLSPLDMIVANARYLWDEGTDLPETMLNFTGDTVDNFLGFFRDKQGRFKLIPFLPEDQEDQP